MDVAYIDTETTSLREPHRPGGRRVWEVAIIRTMEATKQLTVLWLQIADVDLADADPASLRLGRFHDRWSDDYGDSGVSKQVTSQGGRVDLHRVWESEAAALIEEATRGAVIAGSNPAFDMANFADMLARHQLPATWYHHPRDVPNIALGWLAGRLQVRGHMEDDDLRGSLVAEWDGATYSTAALSEACGVPVPADRHSAWADTAWMYEWDAKLRGVDLTAA